MIACADDDVDEDPVIDVAADKRIKALEILIAALEDHAAAASTAHAAVQVVLLDRLPPATAAAPAPGPALAPAPPPPTLEELAAAQLAKLQARLAAARRDLAAHHAGVAEARAARLEADRIARADRVARGEPAKPPRHTLAIPQELLGTPSIDRPRTSAPLA